MKPEIRARLEWVKLYEATKDAGYVCRHCGISRPTLRKWWKRYSAQKEPGLTSLSRRPHTHPTTKVDVSLEQTILLMRQERKLGARRIQNELMRLSDVHLAIATIDKVLRKNQVPPLKRLPRRKVHQRYNQPIPGQRVQMDVCKIASRLYQYTAIDDCSRMRVLALYPRKTATCSQDFLERVIEQFPFPIQRIQTDRGNEFFAHRFQEKLRQLCIKFRPIKPRSPHLNGKVERSQRTDLDEFYSTVDLSDPDLSEKLEEWQFYYNWHRPHSSLRGKTPIERVCELTEKTPLSEQVIAQYFQKQEPIRFQSYQQDLLLNKLKPCL